MAQTNAIRQVGQTFAISVGAVSTTAVTVGPNPTALSNYSAFLNTGPAVVAINIAPNGTATPAVFPVSGTPQNCIVLPALMILPIIYALPMLYSLTAIGSAAGPSTVYITSVAGQ